MAKNKTTLAWIPEHQGVVGNEIMDIVAKKEKAGPVFLRA